MQKTINGLSINYEQLSGGCEDEKACVFILHGWGAELGFYRSIAETAAERYPVVLFDFPGFGKSQEPAESWNVSQFGVLAAEFINSFGFEKIILIGHSFGGRVIIKLSTELNGLLDTDIEKIILVDSAGILPKKSFKVRTKEKMYKTVKKLLLSKPVKKLFPDLLNKFQAKMGSADYAQASPIMRQCLVKTVNEDLTPLLSGIKQPTLLVWGDKDDATPLSDGKLMEELIPDAGLVVLEGAGHYSYIDQPFVFKAVLKSFLKIGA